MKLFEEFYKADLFRYGGVVPKYQKKFLYYLRKSQFSKNKIALAYFKWRFCLLRKKYNIEISSSTTIGKGLYLGHPYCITINPKTILGKNINIHKGVTIGQENRGARKGTPTIGDNVWIGVNSTIVGKITIGDDVLIAPGSFVNTDVPSHSIVFGNPCIIKHKDNATEQYINNEVIV